MNNEQASRARKHWTAEYDHELYTSMKRNNNDVNAVAQEIRRSFHRIQPPQPQPQGRTNESAAPPPQARKPAPTMPRANLLTSPPKKDNIREIIDLSDNASEPARAEHLTALDIVRAELLMKRPDAQNSSLVQQPVPSRSSMSEVRPSLAPQLRRRSAWEISPPGASTQSHVSSTNARASPPPQPLPPSTSNHIDLTANTAEHVRAGDYNREIIDVSEASDSEGHQQQPPNINAVSGASRSPTSQQHIRTAATSTKVPSSNLSHSHVNPPPSTSQSARVAAPPAHSTQSLNGDNRNIHMNNLSTGEPSRRTLAIESSLHRHSPCPEDISGSYTIDITSATTHPRRVVDPTYVPWNIGAPDYRPSNHAIRAPSSRNYAPDIMRLAVTAIQDERFEARMRAECGGNYKSAIESMTHQQDCLKYGVLGHDVDLGKALLLLSNSRWVQPEQTTNRAQSGLKMQSGAAQDLDVAAKAILLMSKDKTTDLKLTENQPLVQQQPPPNSSIGSTEDTQILGKRHCDVISPSDALSAAACMVTDKNGIDAIDEAGGGVAAAEFKFEDDEGEEDSGADGTKKATRPKYAASKKTKLFKDVGQGAASGAQN